jgi:hypothetical protein
MPQPIPQPPGVAPVEAKQLAHRSKQRPAITEHESGRDADPDQVDVVSDVTERNEVSTRWSI